MHVNGGDMKPKGQQFKDIQFILTNVHVNVGDLRPKGQQFKDVQLILEKVHMNVGDHGDWNLTGVPAKVIGLSAHWESPSSESSLRRRFGVQEWSMENGSCSQTVVVRSRL